MRREKAFTLLELLVTLTVAAVLLAAGTPSFKSYLQNQRLAHASYQLVSDLRFARHAAVDRNQRVVICPGSPQLGCHNAPQWEDGWIVFEDRNADRARQPGEPLLRTSPMLQGLSARSSTARRRLSFFPDGSAPGSNATLWLCDNRGPMHGHRVRINLSGRVLANRARDGGTLGC
jgi:type IV fimbrial biogenesis protein FimT